VHPYAFERSPTDHWLAHGSRSKPNLQSRDLLGKPVKPLISNVMPMKLEPYVLVDTTPFSASRNRSWRKGPALKELRNGVGLNELDYGAVVYRFQTVEGWKKCPCELRSSTSEPLTCRSQVLRPSFWQRMSQPLNAQVHRQSEVGLAFDPNCPTWVTALAAHCIDTWRAI